MNCNEQISKISIPKFYKRQALDLLMYAFVGGVRRALPTVSIADSIALFQQEFNLKPDDYPLDTARRTYNRMNHEYFDVDKSSD